ncbi:acetylglutamate kinase [Sutcliffiella halmapala]|uniref:acetylglutamate kinase n=1 Tax=Sutcliffiella halmapala TaxID=79882 RepID=UPI00099569BD|nr:acetylglutamate kinase [Sutcliffiella halmapala]
MNYLIVKCGGSIISKLPASFYTDLVEVKRKGTVHPIIVHGGGPNISSLLHAMNIETTFVNGLRKTTEQVLEVVEMVLSGSVNKQLVRQIMQAGGTGFGLSGVDGMLLEAKSVENVADLGLVGEVVNVNKDILLQIMEKEMIPVISPVAVDKFGQNYNINADMAASAIAKSLQGSLCMITDVDGVLLDTEIVHTLSDKKATSLIENNKITGGMIPKVKAAFDCLAEGVAEVAIINGAKEHALLQFVEGNSVGTILYLEEAIEQIG